MQMHAAHRVARAVPTIGFCGPQLKIRRQSARQCWVRFGDFGILIQQCNVVTNPRTTWTNAAGDLHTVALQPVINVPVTVWIAKAGDGPRATNDIANANLLYSLNKIGVRFTATQNDVSGNATAVETIGDNGRM